MGYVMFLVNLLTTYNMDIQRILRSIIESPNIVVEAFYPYTSIVTMRIAETNINYSKDTDELLQELLAKVRTALEEQLPQARWDNKVVIAFKAKAGFTAPYEEASTLYLGWKDNLIHLGLGMYQPDTYTWKYNIYKPTT